MKAILLSVKPEWVAKILNGEKTVEIRKSAPKCELPITVYIYCTKNKLHYCVGALVFNKDDCFKRSVDGTYKYGDSIELMGYSPDYPYDKNNFLNGKVVAKFTLLRVERFGMAYPYSEPTSGFLKKACLTLGQARTYAGGEHPYYKPLYAWHIEDLVIFDKPKELEEFDYPNPSGTRYVSKRSLNGLPSKKHPPQSWCYVEEVK